MPKRRAMAIDQPTIPSTSSQPPTATVPDEPSSPTAAPAPPSPSPQPTPWWQRPLEEQVQLLIESESSDKPVQRLNEVWGRVRQKLQIPHFDDTSVDEPADSAPDGLPWCGTCRGQRWLRKDVSIDAPGFGQLVRCPACPPVAQGEHRDMLARSAGLVEAQLQQTFETFAQAPGAERALKAARRFADNPSGWLVINGAAGTGKTHLSVAIANALVERLQSVLWRYTPDLVAEVMDENYHLDPQRLKRFVEVPVLVLDELGAASGWVVAGILEPLFDGRYRRRLPTVVTLLASPSTVRTQYSDAIGRRFEDLQLCQVVPNLALPWSPDAPRLRVLS